MEDGINIVTIECDIKNVESDLIKKLNNNIDNYSSNWLNDTDIKHILEEFGEADARLGLLDWKLGHAYGNPVPVLCNMGDSQDVFSYR